MSPKTIPETGDSFEEIEQPGFSGSSTGDQESSDQTNSDQHSSSESSATTMTSPTDLVKTSRLNELEFELAWKTRDEIICNLSQHTKLLSGLLIKADVREKVRKANVDLVATLMNLPLKVDGRLKSFESLERSPDALNEVVLDLSWDVKSRIADMLMTNHHIALLGADSVASEFKSKLIDRNNDLICELLKLRSRTVSKGTSPTGYLDDHLIDQAAKASGLQMTGKTANEEKLGEPDKRTDRNVDATLQQQKPVEQPVTGQTASSPIAEEVAVLKEELEKLKVQIAGKLGKQISDQGSMIGKCEEKVRGLVCKLDETKGELEKFKVRIGGLDVCRSEATFTFELNGVAALLAASPRKLNMSEPFYCRGIPWFVGALPSIRNRVKYLGVFLGCNIIDKDRWSVRATYELRLLSSTPGCDVVEIDKDRIFKNHHPGTEWGWPMFITVDKLRSGSFIQGDTIKIRAHLSTKSFERVRDY